MNSRYTRLTVPAILETFSAWLVITLSLSLIHSIHSFISSASSVSSFSQWMMLRWITEFCLPFAICHFSTMLILCFSRDLQELTPFPAFVSFLGHSNYFSQIMPKKTTTTTTTAEKQVPVSDEIVRPYSSKTYLGWIKNTVRFGDRSAWN